jgi:hypothetical protein
VKVLIKAGAEIDVPTRAEVAEDIHAAWRDHFDAQQRARARGIKAIRFSAPGPVPAVSTLFLPDGPNTGYIWVLRLMSVQLASAGTVLAYITSAAPATSATPQRLIANYSTSSTSQVTTFPSGAAMIYPAESVYLSATTNIAAYFLAMWEVPAEMEYRLL